MNTTSGSRHPDRHRSRVWPWVFRLLLVVSPLLLLGAVEIGLRVVGVGHDTSYLHRVDVDGRPHLRDNPEFFTLFFPDHLLPRALPFTIPVEKGSDEVRIALLGGSAAMGIPEPAFGLAPVLEEMLEIRHAGLDVEVMNLANTAINSHVVRRIAEDLAPLDPDVLVVYLGNNEVVGPFGAGTIFTSSVPSRRVIDLQLFLRSTRVGQLLAHLGDQSGQPVRWRGMEMFLEQTVAHDDPMLARVYENFRDNLRAIVDAADRMDVPVVLATVGVNLRHCAPFASSPPTVEAARFEALVQRADRAWERAAADSARVDYGAALALHPTHADVHYKLGRLELAAGDTARAVEHLALAREYDTLRFRADATINAIVREVEAATSDSRLAEVDGALRVVSPYGLPGREAFLEHVHLDLAGNPTAAQVIAVQVETALAEVFGEPTHPNWPTPNELAQRLAYTGYARGEVLSQVGRLLENPPFTGQSDHAEQTGRIRSELDRLEAARDPDVMRRAWPVIEASIDDEPDAWIRRFRAAAFLGRGLGEWSRAEALMRGITREQPHFVAAWNELAFVLDAQERRTDAIRTYERSLELDPYQPDTLAALATVLRAVPGATGEQLARAAELERRARRMNGQG